MGTLIEAIIFDGDPSAAVVPEGLRTAPLSEGLTMLPVVREVLSRLDPGAIGDERIPADWILEQPVAALARAISRDRRVLYMFTETAGGPGTKEAVAWHKGRLLYGPSGTCDTEADFAPGYHLAPTRDNAVNAGLRAIGVQVANAYDEYQMVGLDRQPDDGRLAQIRSATRRTARPGQLNERHRQEFPVVLRRLIDCSASPPAVTDISRPYPPFRRIAARFPGAPERRFPRSGPLNGDYRRPGAQIMESFPRGPAYGRA
jgi:hypothetical protein